MATYDFIHMDTGHILETIVTIDPDEHITDIAVSHRIHPEEIFYELAPYGVEEAIDELWDIQLIDLTGKEADEARDEIVAIFHKLAGE